MPWGPPLILTKLKTRIQMIITNMPKDIFCKCEKEIFPLTSPFFLRIDSHWTLMATKNWHSLEKYGWTSSYLLTRRTYFIQSCTLIGLLRHRGDDHWVWKMKSLHSYTLFLLTLKKFSKCRWDYKNIKSKISDYLEMGW